MSVTRLVPSSAAVASLRLEVPIAPPCRASSVNPGANPGGGRWGGRLPLGRSFTIQDALFNSIQAPVCQWAPSPGRDPVCAPGTRAIEGKPRRVPPPAHRPATGCTQTGCHRAEADITGTDIRNRLGGGVGGNKSRKAFASSKKRECSCLVVGWCLVFGGQLLMNQERKQSARNACLLSFGESTLAGTMYDCGIATEVKLRLCTAAPGRRVRRRAADSRLDDVKISCLASAANRRRSGAASQGPREARDAIDV